MFGFFSSKKNKNKGKNAKTPQNAKNLSGDDLRQMVQQQLADKRAEMGPEALEKLQLALQAKQAKAKLRAMADDDDKRARMLDEIRAMRQSNRPDDNG